MRRSLLLILPGVLLYLPVQAGAGEPKTADEAIAKYIEAIGGRQKLDSLKTMRWTGKTVMQGGLEAPIAFEFKRPKKLRIEFTFQGMTGTQAYDGQTGWFVMPFMGKNDPEKMSADQVEQIDDQADFGGPLVDYQKKGHQVELAGADEIEGSPTYKLKVTKKNGDVEYYHLDSEHFLTLAVNGKRKFQGTEIEVEVTFGDYKEVEGYMMAHTIDQKVGGVSMSTMVIEKVAMNPEIPDDRFSMPEVKEKDKPDAEQTPSEQTPEGKQEKPPKDEG